MKRVLCFGDSHTWGYIPHKEVFGLRYSFSIRFPGRLAQLLGASFQIIEEGLFGRTTALEDPNRQGRNGQLYLGPCLESHNPLELVVLMLGTNDLKICYYEQSLPKAIAERMHTLVRMAKTLGKDAEGQPPKVLLVAPPYPQMNHLPGAYQPYFLYPQLEASARQLAPLYQEIAVQEDIFFWDSGPYLTVSPRDGVHLDEGQHEKLAQLLREQISHVLDG